MLAEKKLSEVKSLRATANNIYEQYQIARSKETDEKAELKKLRRRLKDLLAVQSHVQRIAQDCQQRVHERIAAVVSKCLSTVFDDPYSFRIQFVQRRGKTDAVLSFYRDGLEVDPLEAAGGGPVDIAVVALRLACVLCSRPKLRRLLVLDEPFKHLAPELHPLAARMLMELSKETKTQIILVTHSKMLSEAMKELGGKVIQIK